MERREFSINARGPPIRAHGLGFGRSVDLACYVPFLVSDELKIAVLWSAVQPCVQPWKEDARDTGVCFQRGYSVYGLGKFRELRGTRKFCDDSHESWRGPSWPGPTVHGRTKVSNHLCGHEAQRGQVPAPESATRACVRVR